VAMQWAKLKKNISKSTMEEYRKDMNAQILPIFGNRPISSVTELDIEYFISDLKCSSSKRKINIMTPFREVMKFAKKHKIIVENPMDEVDRIKKEPTDKHPLSLSEIKIFLEAVPVYYKPLFMFLFFTGVRFGEAAALKWKRVNFKDGEVHIRKTLVRGEYKDPKTKSSIRFVKLSSMAIKALQSQKEHTFGKSDFVFLNRFGRNIHQHSVNIHVFKPTLIKAGLSSGSSCKDTRSSYITNSLDNNERMGFVQKQVGHATTKMIIEHYYNHIPAPGDGKGLEKAFTDTISGDDLIPETTE